MRPLPQTDGRTRATSQRAPDRETLDGVRVLLVEDHADSFELESELLEWDGATVRAVRTVADALRIFEREQIDVVVSDLAMPVASGYDLVRWIRARRDAKRSVPLLAISGHPEAVDGEHALEQGFDVFLEKPIETDTFLSAVRKLASGKPRRARRSRGRA
jgi:CheY-like chemotaxis protein